MNIRLPARTRQPGRLVIAVTGGRHFSDEYTLYEALDQVEALADKARMLLTIVEGGATGADRMARKWALLNHVNLVIERADWTAHGKAAGPLRNQAIIDRHHPDLCIAMPGGRGTADMVARCKAAGIPVFDQAS